jgi:hypothetical protein
MSSPSPSDVLLRDLLCDLREAGLDGQVRLGSAIRATGPLETAPRRAPAPDPPPYEESHEDGEDRFAPDALLQPGVRPDQGRLIELSGARSSGRTALAYRMAAGTTASGALVGWVDLPNALDPRFLRRAGLDLSRLLWARPRDLAGAMRSTELLLRAGFATVVLDVEDAPARELARLGAAAWTRLLRAVRGTRATAVLLSSQRVAGSFATLGLYTERSQPLFDRGLFEGLDVRASVVRDRAGPTGAELPFRILHRPT